MTNTATREIGYPLTPELERMRAAKDDASIVARFLEWMDDEKLFLATYHEHQGSDGEDDEKPSGCWEAHNCGTKAKPCHCRRAADKICGRSDEVPVMLNASKEVLLARYFKIDLKKIDQEKQAIMDWLQLTPKEREAEEKKIIRSMKK